METLVENTNSASQIPRKKKKNCGKETCRQTTAESSKLSRTARVTRVQL